MKALHLSSPQLPLRKKTLQRHPSSNLIINYLSQCNIPVLVFQLKMSCCIAKISPSLRKPQSDSSGSSDSDSDSDLIGPPLPPQYSDEHMKQGDTCSDDDEEEEASDAEDDVSLIM